MCGKSYQNSWKTNPTYSVICKSGLTKTNTTVGVDLMELQCKSYDSIHYKSGELGRNFITTPRSTKMEFEVERYDRSNLEKDRCCAMQQHQVESNIWPWWRLNRKKIIYGEVVEIWVLFLLVLELPHVDFWINCYNHFTIALSTIKFDGGVHSL